MNSLKQIRSLLLLQILSNPFIFFIVLIFLTPSYLAHSSHIYNISTLFAVQNLFLVGIVGVMLLAPEIFISYGVGASRWQNISEFVLTRAVDRHLIFRARLLFFCFLTLTMPSITLVLSLKHPKLQITEYKETLHRQILERIPGSFASTQDPSKSGDITLPNGATLISSFVLWEFVATTLMTEILICWVYPLKYRKTILLGIHWTVIFLLLAVLFGSPGSIMELEYYEKFFLAYVTYEPWFWAVILLSFVIVHFWCERRFSSYEQ